MKKTLKDLKEAENIILHTEINMNLYSIWIGGGGVRSKS